MIVAAGLCWFDEEPETLDRCVRSLAGFVDRLVAVDGVWALWPEQAERSPQNNRDALIDACADINIELDLYDGRWETQVEKRNAAIQAAAQDADWVMPLDADWVFEGDSDLFRRTLEITPCDSGLVPFVTPMPEGDVSHFDQWHQETAGTTMRLNLVYRALPGLRCEGWHWYYLAEKGSRTVSLWGDRAAAAPTFATRGLTIHHRCFDRSFDRAVLNRSYIEQRTLLSACAGVEA